MCDLTSTTLAANTPTIGTGLWSIVSGTGGTITTPTNPTSTFSGDAGETYILRWTISNAPCTPSTDDVTITFQQSPTPANAGSDQTGSAMCDLTATTLEGNTPTIGTGLWTIISGTGGTITTPTNPTSTFSGDAGETYVLRWTISNAPCTPSTDDVTITFQQSPTPANAGTDQTGSAMCDLTSTTLAANTPTIGTGLWSIVSGTGGTITTPTNPTSTFSGTAGETYVLRWTISNAPCTPSTDDVTVTFRLLPTANAGSALADICQGVTSVPLGGSVGGSATGGIWSDGAVGGTFSPSATDLNATWTPPATYFGTATLSLETTGGICGTDTDSKSITVIQNATLALASGNNNQTLCINTPITNITYSVGGSGNGGSVTGLPTGVTGVYSGGTITISGTPSQAGVFDYTVTTSGPCITPTTTGRITVTPDATISLSSGAGSDNQTICINTALAPIRYAIGGSGNNASVSGLPAGVTGTFSGGTFTINGIPSVSGTFNYTVTALGPCAEPTINGSITVTPNATIALTSANNNQTICINTPVQNITFAVGASGNNASATGLPPGVTGSYSAGIFTISGTPTVAGAYTYVVTASGPCEDATAGGTISVTPDATISLASGNTSQTVCINSPISAISYSIGGSGTGAGVTGLPDGVSGNYSAGTFTISGTPTESGTFPYTVTAIGPCVRPTATGSITVTPDATIALSSANNNQTICIYEPLINITYNIGGSGTGATVSGLPSGLSGNFNSGVFTISGTPTVSGVFPYTVTAIGPCAEPSSAGTVTVIALPVTTASNNGPVCIGTPLTLTGGPDGMTSYYWTGPNGYSSVLQNPTVAASATSAMAGVYTLLTTNSNGCQNSASTTVIVNPLPSPSASDNSPICEGDLLTLTGGQDGMILYSWTGPDGFISDQQSPVVSNSATLAMEGEYSLTVTNSNGCVNTVSTDVTINPLPTATISGSTTVCKDDAFPNITFTGSNGTAPYTFTYRINGGPDQYVSTSVGNSISVPVPTGISDVYNYALVSVRDLSSTRCENPQTGSATVIVNPLPTATISGTAAVCQYDSYPNITFTGASGTAPYTFIYTINSEDPQIISTTGTNTSVSVPVQTEEAGIFTYSLVSVEDASATTCAQNQGGSATVTVNALPTASISGSTEICKDSPSPNVTFTGASGRAPYTFTYTINGGGLQTVATTTGSSVNVAVPTSTAGTLVYELISVQDATSTHCEQVQPGTVTIVVNPLPTATVTGSTSVCQFAAEPLVTFTGSGGTAPYTFTYTVNSGSNQIIVATGNSVSIPVPTETPGTFTYALSNVRDASSTSCSRELSRSATVVVNPLPEATISGSADVCQNGPSPSVTFTASDGTPPYLFTYRINGGSTQSVSTVTGSVATISAPTDIAGTFIYELLTVRDQNSLCVQAQGGTARILVNPLPTATISGTTSVCRNDTPPEIVFTGSGGTAPYTFIYSINGQPSQSISTLSGNSVTIYAPADVAGVFTYSLISVRDASSTLCTNPQPGQAVITVNELPVTPAISGSQTPACSAAGQVYSVPLTAGSSYSWLVPDGASITSGMAGPENNSITVDFGIYNGNISVIETNVNGCSGSQVDLPISLQGCALDANFTVSSTSVCDGSALTFTDISTGTSGATTYSWNFGAGASPATRTGIGPHTVTYTGTGSRTVSLTISEGASDTETKLNYITVFPLPTAIIGGTTEVCEDDPFPLVTFTGSNGTPPYTFTYTIDGGSPLTVASTGSSVSVPVPTGNPGTFVYALVSVRDASSSTCFQSASGSASITVNPLPTATIDGSTEVCRYDSEPVITFTGSNGTAPYEFTYSINGAASQTISSDGSGVATLNVPTVATGSFEYELLGVSDNSSTACSNIADGSVEVIVNPLPTASISGTTVVCMNGTPPNITFTGANGKAPYTFTYTVNSGDPEYITTIVGSSVTVPVPTGSTGDFTYELVSVQDDSFSGCSQSASGSATVTVNPLPLATISGDAEVCRGGDSPNITFTGSNGTAPYTFTYTINNGTALTVTSTGNIASIPAPTGVTGDFVYNLVSVRDASSTACSQVQTGSVLVTVNPVPRATISGTAAVCQDNVSPEIVFTGSNGTEPYTFTYTVNSSAPLTVVSVGNTARVAVPTDIPGSFTYALVSVEDASTTSCSQTQTGSATVRINPLPAATIGGTTTVCRDAGFPNITFTGSLGTAPYTFTYTINNGTYQTVTSSAAGIANVAVPTGTTGTFVYDLISVRDASGTTCSNNVTGSATITINPLPTATISGSATVCRYDTPPELTFTGSNGTPPYRFVYSVNSGSDQIVTSDASGVVNVPVPTTNTGTFTYSLRSVEDASSTSCSSTQSGSASIVVNPLPTALISGTTQVCQGDPSPRVTFTGFSFSGFEPFTFTYSINGGEALQVTTTSGSSVSVPVPTGEAGTFLYELISVRDASSTTCEQTQSGSALITVNPLPTATISGSTDVCRYEPSPYITFTGSGGTEPYTFIYRVNDGSLQSVSGISGSSATVPVPTSTPGTFVYSLVSVEDAGSTTCSRAQTGTATVVVNTLPLATVSGSTVVCQNSPSPGITFTGSNGTPPYTFTYTINNGGTLSVTTSSASSVTVPVSTASAGTFNYELLSVRDGSSSTCEQAQSGSATVIVNPLPSATISGTASVCRNAAPPAVTFTGSGGTAPYLFTYSINGQSPLTVSSTSGNSVSIDAPTGSAGTYRYDLISVRDASTTHCLQSQTGTAVITVNELPSTSAITGNASPACFATGEVYSVNLTSGSVYSWMVPDGAIITSGMTGPGNNSITVNFGSGNGNVSVIETNSNGCSGSRIDLPVSLQGCALDANFAASSTSVCDGSSIVFTDLSTGTSGTTIYNWTFGAGATPSAATGAGPHSVTYTGTGTRSVSLTITEGASDTETKINYITVNPLPTATIGGSTNVCEDATPPLLTFTGSSGTAPYIFTYTLDGGAPLNVTSTGGGIATVAVPTSTPGTYTYELIGVQDASSSACSQDVSGTAVIRVNPLPSATISGSTTVCRDDTPPEITFTGSGGTAPYTFTYTVNNGTPQSVGTTMGNTVSITVPTGTTGTFSYELVSVRDGSSTGCSQVQSGSAEVLVNPLPSATIGGTTIVCRDDVSPVVTFTGSGGTAPYTFVYTVNSGDPETVTTIVGNSVTVPVPTDTEGIFTYALESVSDRAGTGCSRGQTGSATITVNPLPTATIQGSAEVCRDGIPPEITFTGFDGKAPYTFTYTVNGGSPQGITTTVGNSISIPVATGSVGVFEYRLLQVQDNSTTHCSQVQTGTATVTVNPLPQATVTGTATVCRYAASPSVTFIGSNGTAPYTFTYTVNSTGPYTITTQSGNSVSIPAATDVVGSHTYALVSVRDASSTTCVQGQNGSVTVTVEELPTATIAGSTAVCQFGTFPNITFAGAGGNAPYTFTYNINGGSSQSITSELGNSISIPVPTGTAGTFVYELENVRDAGTNSCEQAVTATATVIVNPLPEATISGTRTVCRFDPEPYITFTGSNGTAPYIFTYSINGGGSQQVASAGGSTVTVAVPTDNAGVLTYSLLSVRDASSTLCSQSQSGTAEVTVSPLPSATIAGSATVCRNDTPPSIVFTGSNGTAPYTFVYTINGGADQVVESIGSTATVSVPTAVAGTFEYELVSVQDASASTCSRNLTGSATVIVNPLPVGVITGSTAVCRNDAQPQLTFTGSGGTAPYTFTYSINGASPLSITTISGNSISINVPTSSAGVFTYELLQVDDDSFTSCSDTPNSTAVVTVFELPATSAISGNQTPACGAAGVSYSVSLTTGSTYTWIVPDGAIITSGVLGPNNNSITVNFGSTNGNISVIETNANGCVGEQVNLPVSLQGCALNANFTVSSTNVCDGSGVTFSDLSTGISPTTAYSWNFGGGATPATATGSGPHYVVYNGTGLRTVSLTIIEGATDIETKVNYITVNPLPTATISGTTAVCENGASPLITFTGDDGTAPYTFTYSVDGGIPRTVSTVSGNSATVPVPTATPGVISYELLSVRDASASTCVQAQSGTAVVTVNQLPEATISGTTEVCRDGVSPFITFTGSGGTPPYQFTYTIDGGTPYSIGSGAGNIALVPVPTGLVGTFEYELVSVHDYSSTACSQAQSGSATVTVNPLPTATIGGTQIVCRYDTPPNVIFTGSGGTAPYTFTYTINSGPEQTVTTLFGSSVTVAAPTDLPGSYTYSLVSVSDGSLNACEKAQSGSATITVNPLPSALITGSTVVCKDDTPPEITFTGLSGIEPFTFTYTMNGGGLQTVTSSSGSSATITVPTGSPGDFVYELVSVRDASIATCEQSQTGSVTVKVNPLPRAQISGTAIVCRFDPEPLITFTGSNGTAPYTFAYTINSGSLQTITSEGNSVTVAAPTNLTGGFTYSLVSVTDASETVCSQFQSGSATITVNPLPTGTIRGTIEVCQDDVSPEVTFTGAGGTEPYTFIYSINGGGALSVTSTGNSADVAVPTGTAGVFDYELLRVIDASASICEQIQTGVATITINPLPEAIIEGTTSVCRNSASPLVTFTGSNGTAPYTFFYTVNGGSPQVAVSPGGSTASVAVPTGVTGLITYELIAVQDASNTTCYQAQTGTATIRVLELPTAAISGATRVCRDSEYPLVTFTGSDGTAPYTFTYNINGGAARTVTTTSGNSVTVAVPTETAGIFTYELISVRDAGVVSCSQAQSGSTIITIDEIPATNAGTGGQACEYDFRLNALPDIGTGTWTMTSGSGSATFFPDANTPDALVTVSQLGTKEFTWTEVNGSCTNFASVEVTFYEMPVANAGFGGNECDLDFVLNAVPGLGSGVWSMTSGSGSAIFIPGPASPDATVIVTAEGVKEFTWTVTNGACVDSESIEASFYLQPEADPGEGGNNCGLTFILGANPSHGTGMWTITNGPGNAVFSPGASSPDAEVTVDAYGTYEFTWTETNGTCTDAESINVVFIEIPATNAGDDGEACKLDYDLHAVPGTGTGTGTWTVVTGPGSAVFTTPETEPDVNVSVDTYGAYYFRWTEVNAVCQSSDIVEVVFRKIPDIYAGRDTVICLGDDAQLDAIGEGAFSWLPVATLDDSQVSNPVASPVERTEYIVTVMDEHGCYNSDTIVVDPWPQPIAFAGEDLTLEYLFTAWTEAELKLHESGLWEVVEGGASFDDPTQGAAFITNLSLGENIFQWTVTNGVCPATFDYLVITVNDLVIPTLITPNLDGRNDYFQLRGIETLGRTELVIFDRNGAMVYRNTDYDNSWDGVDQNGKQLPEDTYFFTIMPANGKAFKGYIVIRR
jgi:gliding motility-associated-like protein